MEQKHVTNCSIISSVRRTKPVVFYRVTAGLAVIAWLALAGDAFAQGTNQWAPTPQAAPVVQPSQPSQVWTDGGNGGAPVYAPTDLDLRLNSSTRPVAQTAPLYAPAAQATAAAPVYAPLSLANPVPSVQAPGYPSAPVANQTYGAAPIAPGQGYGGYGYGYPTMPYGGAGYGGMPYGAAPGYPGGFGGFPYNSVPGVYPGAGIAPGMGNWGSPYNSNNSFTGIPFFGGSPFGFW